MNSDRKRSWLRSRPERAYRYRFINVLLITAMLFGLVTPIALANGSTQPARTAANCDVPANVGGVKLYMPLLAGAGQMLRAAFQPAAAPTEAPRALAYEVGKTYTYEWHLEINTRSAARDSQGAIDEGADKNVFYAHVDVIIVDEDAEGAFHGRVSLRNPFICSSHGEGESVVDDADLVTALASPMEFKQKATGEIVEVTYPQDAPLLAVNIQKGIVNALQVSLRQSESAYAVQETGGQGVYTAAYNLAEEGDNLRVTKTFNQDSFVTLIQSGNNGALQLQTTVKLLLDGDKGMFSTVEVTEEIISSDESEDPDSTDGPGMDGVAAWSRADTSGSLRLMTVRDTPAQLMAALPAAARQTGGLGAELPESIPNNAGIDLEAIDLEAEFAAFEADPESPELSQRMLALLDADEPDERAVVLPALAQRLQAAAGDDAVAAAYLDVLGQNGSPAAQELLNAVLGAAVSAQWALPVDFSDAAMQQALINISTLDTPTDLTLDTVEMLSDGDPASTPLQNIALTVLGAAAYNAKDDNPERAAEIVDKLNSKLAQVAAQANGDVSLVLDAIGNAGDASSLDGISEFVTAQDLESRVSALDALRKIPGDEAEELLLGALNDDDEDDAVRYLVASLLGDRDLSEEAAAALQDYEEHAALATPGLHQLYWHRHLGGSNAGVDLPGRLTVASPPVVSGLYVYGDQQANAHIWAIRYQLARAQVLSRREAGGQKFGAYFSIANNRITRNYEVLLACSTARNGVLYQGSLTIFNISYRIPIYWVVSVTLNVQATGYFSLSFSYSHNLCNPANISAAATIIPLVYASASASAWVDVVVARGGATLQADLMRTSIPTGISAAYDGASLRFCTDIRVVTQALNGRLFAWADVRVPRWGIPPWKWKRVLEGNLWTFSTPTATYNLLVRCW